MNNRISTGMMFSQSVSLMLSKQAKMSHLEQQLATGQRLVSAKDDGRRRHRGQPGPRRGRTGPLQIQRRRGAEPSGPAGKRPVRRQRTDGAHYRIDPAGQQPCPVGGRPEVDRLRLQTVYDSLLSLANTTDGTGRYLFGGTDDADAPFKLSNGTVSYNGDQTQRQVEVAPDTFVKDALPGSEIFLRIRTGDGTLDGAAAAGNTGNGVLTTFGLNSSSGNWNGGSYSLNFTAADQYEVLDSTGTVVGTGTFKAGGDISFEGVSMRIEGAPAAGDSFSIGPSGTRDVFSTVQGMIDALNTAANTPPRWPASRTHCSRASAISPAPPNSSSTRARPVVRS